MAAIWQPTMTPEEEAEWMATMADQDQAQAMLARRTPFSPRPLAARTVLIMSAIKQRWPTMVLPKGAQAALAQEFGVSRQRISQITSAMGAVIAPAPPAPIRNPCAKCGNGSHRPRRGGLCEQCKPPTITIMPCAWCGNPKMVNIKNHAWRTGRKWLTPSGPRVYTGRVFCNRSCFGTWFGNNYGVGHRTR